MRKLGAAIAAVIAGVGLAPASGFAADSTATWDNWTNISLQYAYTWDSGNDEVLGYGSESDSRNQVRFEFERLWKYGEFYAFVDWINAPKPLGGFGTVSFGGFPVPNCCGEGDRNQWYGVANANLSAQKVFGLQRGLFDVALEGRVGYSSYYNFNEEAIGASVYVNVPGFVQKPGDKIQFTYWRRWKDDDFVSGPFDPGGAASEKYADHNFWGITIRKEWEMFGLDWQHQTFFRYQQKETTTGKELSDPARIFWESEIFAHLNKNLMVGFRSEYFYNETGIIKDNIFAGEKDHWRPLIAVKYEFDSDK